MNDTERGQKTYEATTPGWVVLDHTQPIEDMNEQQLRAERYRLRKNLEQKVDAQIREQMNAKVTAINEQLVGRGLDLWL